MYNQGYYIFLFIGLPQVAGVLTTLTEPEMKSKIQEETTKTLSGVLAKLRGLKRLDGVPSMDPKLKALIPPLVNLSVMSIDDPGLLAEFKKPSVVQALRDLEGKETQLLALQDMLDRYFIAYCVLAALIFVMNIVLGVTFLRMKENVKYKQENVLLYNQANSDFIVGLSVLLQSLHTNSFGDNERLRQCAMFLLHFSYYLSCNCLLLSATERMTAFYAPKTHAKIFPRGPKLFLVIGIVRVLSTIPSICHSTYVDLIEDELWYDKRYANYMTSFFVILLVTMLAVYSFSIATCVAVRKNKGAVDIQMRNLGEKPETDVAVTVTRPEKSYIGIFLAHSIFFAISYLPLAVVVIIDVSDGSGLVVEHWLAVVVVYMVSAIFNPLVTLAFKDDYRKTLFCSK